MAWAVGVGVTTTFVTSTTGTHHFLSKASYTASLPHGMMLISRSAVENANLFQEPETVNPSLWFSQPWHICPRKEFIAVLPMHIRQKLMWSVRSTVARKKTDSCSPSQGRRILEAYKSKMCPGFRVDNCSQRIPAHVL